MKMIRGLSFEKVSIQARVRLHGGKSENEDVVADVFYTSGDDDVELEVIRDSDRMRLTRDAVWFRDVRQLLMSQVQSLMGKGKLKCQ